MSKKTPVLELYNNHLLILERKLDAFNDLEDSCPSKEEQIELTKLLIHRLKNKIKTQKKRKFWLELPF